MKNDSPGSHKKAVAICNVENCKREDFTQNVFGQWVDLIGGQSRVARVLGVDRTTIYRQMLKEYPDPLFYYIMKTNLKNAELIKEIKRLENELKNALD